jgi:glycosyltransferase involved in cell wall biosynthesis
MSATLILITNHFPYGSGEAFIEAEYKILAQKFSRVIILCRDTSSAEKRPGDYICHRLNPESNWMESLLMVPLTVKHLGRVLNYLRHELKYLSSTQKLKASTVKTLMHDLGKALITSHHLSNLISHYNIKGNLVLYSYWLTSSALATTFARAKNCSIRKIARAHGGDVYEERNQQQYLSFRNSLGENLDRIYPISENGQHYLKARIHPSNHHKLQVSRLGTLQQQKLANPVPGKKKLIVSCSFLLPVKRIHVMIEVLALVTQSNIEWIHIGDGPLASELQDLARKKLSGKSNVTYSFKGTLSPPAIQEFYLNNPVYLFWNLSESEGIPVTMMEAQSYGIPVLGLDVGGVSEIVNNRNGRLLPAHVTSEEIATELTQLLNLSAEPYQNLREAAWQNWNTLYNAERNFSTFADQILKLHNEVG